MARQSTDEKRPFDSGSWFETWNAEHRKRPWIVKTRLQTPLIAGSRVSLVIAPHSGTRDHLKCYEDSRYQQGYELPLCIVREQLTAGAAYQLETALKLIERLQGLGPHEGLAFMFYLHLLLAEQLRSADGKESLLLGVTWGKADFPPAFRWRALRVLLSSPAGSIAHLLTSWTRYGMRLAQGFCRPEDGSAGRPTYLIIPPFWISEKDFDRFGGLQLSTVPIFVRSTTAPLARHLVGTLSAALDMGKTLDFSIASESRAKSDNESPAQDVRRHAFQWNGEHWKVSFDGNVLPLLNDLKGLRLIHHLIEHKGKDFTVLELCRTVLDKPDVPSGRHAHEEEGGVTTLFARPESAMERGTPEEHNRLRRELQKRKEKVEQIVEMGGQPSIDLQLEIDSLQERIAADFDSKGRPRWDSGASRKAQVRVNKLLDTAEEKLGSHCEGLMKHLQNTIHRKGAMYAYRPDREMDWDL